jgi:hypothetical protein
MAFVHYSPETPEGREAQLQAIAIVTAGLDSPELLQQELMAALKAKPDAKSWTLLTIALGQVGMKMAGLAATLDAHNVEVVSGVRDQVTPFNLLQNWAQSIVADGDISDVTEEGSPS